MDRHERPASPVVTLMAWRDEAVEALAENLKNDWAWSFASEAELDRLDGDLSGALVGVAEAKAQLIDLEVEWRDEDRGPFFRWGLAEIEAERAAIQVYRLKVDTALQRVKKEIKRRRLVEAKARVASEEEKRLQRKEARERERAALAQDPKLEKAVACLIAAAYGLVRASAEDWDPDSTLGLKLRLAVAEHTKAQGQIRSEHQTDG